MRDEEPLVRSGTPSSDSFAVECLGTVNQLSTLNWAQLAKHMSLIPWIQQKVALHARGRGSNDLVLQACIFIFYRAVITAGHFRMEDEGGYR